MAGNLFRLANLIQDQLDKFFSKARASKTKRLGAENLLL